MAGVLRNIPKLARCSGFAAPKLCLQRSTPAVAQLLRIPSNNSQDRSLSIWHKPSVISNNSGVRHYAGPAMSRQQIEERVMLVLRLYDKINPETITLDSHFMNDCGLDSLDHVEVVMSMEDEFEYEIPEQDTERLLTPKDIVQYICDRDDIYE